MDHKQHMHRLAERAVENAETAAQLEVEDTGLRESLIRNIEAQLHVAYQLAASA